MATGHTGAGIYSVKPNVCGCLGKYTTIFKAEIECMLMNEERGNRRTAIYLNS